MKNFFTVVCKVFLSVVSKVFLSVVSKCSCSSRGVRRELNEGLLVKYFLCVGNLGFTRPIQDYGSGPGIRDGGQV